MTFTAAKYDANQWVSMGWLEWKAAAEELLGQVMTDSKQDEQVRSYAHTAYLMRLTPAQFLHNWEHDSKLRAVYVAGWDADGQKVYAYTDQKRLPQSLRTPVDQRTVRNHPSFSQVVTAERGENAPLA